MGLDCNATHTYHGGTETRRKQSQGPQMNAYQENCQKCQNCQKNPN